jgi:signal transduction histidine kinase
MTPANDIVPDPEADVLLVDDEPANLVALQAILADPGLNLAPARSGEEALRLLLDTDFAVILLDIQMAGLDGFQTAQLIRGRERSRSTPIVFLTAYESPAFPVAQAYALGAVDYLVKPLVPAILRAKVAGFVEQFHKTQALRRQAERLRQTSEELRRSNQELEQFAWVASHDLQEPLRQVRIYLQLLERNYRERLDAPAQQYIDHAVGAAGHMQELVRDLLAYARVSRGAVPSGPVDGAAAFDQAVATLETAIREGGAEVTRGPLPMVRADAGQLTQVFQNLLSNALKFRGPQPPVVRAEALREGDLWRFTVRDNGIGIDPAFAGRIFILFERLHNRREYPGTGIGLAICKKVVERHGGSIGVDSEPGRGATFWFTLPAAGGTAP